MSGMLITLGVKCHNQRRTVGAAIEAAFGQTYRPLEIVVSDDGSTDGSWELIRELCRGREEPGLKVVLNRNPVNLGNMGNWLRICELSHGEWIVKADGDDISESSRVERIAECVCDTRPEVYVVSSGCRKIDGEGRVCGQVKTRSAWYPLGAVMAFHRRCYTDFPVPSDGRNVDDEVFARRALILGDGREARIDEPLVRYRVGSGISSAVDDIRESELRCMRLKPRTFGQLRRDLEALTKTGLLKDEAERRKWLEVLARQEREVADEIELRSAPTFARRLRAWRRHPARCPFRPYGIKLLVYLLPRRTGDAVLRLLTRIRYR